jgi:tetratricopeptide (TPR) repeat protein
MRGFLLGAAALAIVPMLAWADTVPPPPTVQQAFDAATALQDGGKFADALAAWEKLEPRVANKPRSLAIVRLRKGLALFRLDRRDEAVIATRAALEVLPSTEPALRDDRIQGYNVLAKVAEVSLDYATAADNYRRAEALANTPIEHLGTLRGLVETETFFDSDAAVADLARVQPWLADKSVDNVARASLKRVESQLLLNRGDFAGARTAAGEAVKLLGGLTSKTDLNDVAARSNYAIAAMMLGDRDDARKYMAYTGAGRVPTGSFDPAVQMTPPDCGGDSDLRPDDTAVVEFSIGDDGAITYAVPVYSSRGGKVALQFARAVRNWSWTPEQVKALPAFFRYRARVEMRCSTEFAKPSLLDYLDKRLAQWLGERGIDAPLKRDGADAALLAAERGELADLEKAKGADSLALVPVLHILSRNTVPPIEETAGFARREAAILTANKAPPMARLSADLKGWQNKSSDSWGGRRYFRILEAAAASGPYAEDPEARAVLRLLMSDASRGFDKDRSVALLDQVANDAALPGEDGFKVGALIRKASIYAQRGDLAAAKAAYAQTGTTADQCSLIDSSPRFLGAGGSFPDEAKMWGFEGWVAVQFDVGADGRTVNQRAVISYPPFIFSKAGDDTLKTARYEKAFRPDGGVGCGGITQRVKFTMHN